MLKVLINVYKRSHIFLLFPWIIPWIQSVISASENLSRKTFSDEEFNVKTLVTLNNYRKLHGVPPIEFDSQLAEHAAKWATRIQDKASKDNKLRAYYSHPHIEGENVMVHANSSIDGGDAINQWYSEMKNYDFSKNMFLYETAQFTQLVWKETSEMGIAMIFDSVTNYTVIVARFRPPGNIGSAISFEENVLPLMTEIGHNKKRPMNIITTTPVPLPEMTSAGLPEMDTKPESQPEKKPEIQGRHTQKKLEDRFKSMQRSLISDDNVWNVPTNPPAVAVPVVKLTPVKRPHMKVPQQQQQSNNIEEVVSKPKSTGKYTNADAVSVINSNIALAQHAPMVNKSKPVIPVPQQHIGRSFEKKQSPVGEKLVKNASSTLIPLKQAVVPLVPKPTGKITPKPFQKVSEKSPQKNPPAVPKAAGRSLETKPSQNIKVTIETTTETLIDTTSLTDEESEENSTESSDESESFTTSEPTIETTTEKATSQPHLENKLDLKPPENKNISKQTSNKNLIPQGRTIDKKSDAKPTAEKLNATVIKNLKTQVRPAVKQPEVKPASKLPKLKPIPLQKGRAIPAPQLNPTNLPPPTILGAEVTTTDSSLVESDSEEEGDPQDRNNAGEENDGVEITTSYPGTVEIEVTTASTNKTKDLVPSDQMKFAEEGLIAHNKYRKLHGVPPLKLDPRLITESYDWAKKNVESCDSKQKCVLTNTNRQDRGENIYAVKGVYMMTGSKPVEYWYSEIKNYNWTKPGYQWKAGHFTQVIWKNSKTMGMAWYKSKKGIYVSVAFYYPPGNVAYQQFFRGNVLPMVGLQN